MNLVVKNVELKSKLIKKTIKPHQSNHENRQHFATGFNIEMKLHENKCLKIE